MQTTSPAPTGARARERVVVTDVALRDGLQNQPAPCRDGRQGCRSCEPWPPPACRASRRPASCRRRRCRRWPTRPRSSPRPSRSRRCARPRSRPTSRASSARWAAGTREIAVVLSCTETMNRKNINMSLAEALRVSCDTLRAASASGLATRGYLAVAFECPVRGRDAGRRACSSSVRPFSMPARTRSSSPTPSALPARPVSRRCCAGWCRTCRSIALGLHLHDTRGMGVANAYAGSSWACDASMPASADWAAAPSHPARRATSPPRTWC